MKIKVFKNQLVNYRVDRYFIVGIKLRILDITTVEKFDSKKMYKIYDEWPIIARKSWEKNYDKFKIEKVKHVVFAGMGGSGTLGDFFAAILSKTNLHVNVVKGYILPKNVTSKTLIVIVSVSGNTTETLEILKSAKKIGCNIIVFSSGGQMEKYCKKNKINFRKVLKFNSDVVQSVNLLPSTDAMAAFITEGAPAEVLNKEIYVKLDRRTGKLSFHWVSNDENIDPKRNFSINCKRKERL